MTPGQQKLSSHDKIPGFLGCPADNTLAAAMQAVCSRLAARVLAHGAGSSSCTALGRRQVLPGAPLACGMATMVRPPSVRDAQVRIFGWAQPDTRRGEGRQGHAPMKTLEKMKRRGLIGQKVPYPRRSLPAPACTPDILRATHLHALTPCLARADGPGG